MARVSYLHNIIKKRRRHSKHHDFKNKTDEPMDKARMTRRVTNGRALDPPSLSAQMRNKKDKWMIQSCK